MVLSPQSWEHCHWSLQHPSSSLLLRVPCTFKFSFVFLPLKRQCVHWLVLDAHWSTNLSSMSRLKLLVKCLAIRSLSGSLNPANLAVTIFWSQLFWGPNLWDCETCARLHLWWTFGFPKLQPTSANWPTLCLLPVASFHLNSDLILYLQGILSAWLGVDKNNFLICDLEVSWAHRPTHLQIKFSIGNSSIDFRFTSALMPGYSRKSPIMT